MTLSVVRCDDPSEPNTAARALLDISQGELAQRAKVGLATVRRIENSVEDMRATVKVVLRIQRALESAGIVLIDQDEDRGPGVRLRRPLG